jgi:hypothetical protein
MSYTTPLALPSTVGTELGGMKPIYPASARFRVKKKEGESPPCRPP